MFPWNKEGVPYHLNPDCPKLFLEGVLVSHMQDVYGDYKIPIDKFSDCSREYICNQIAYYEELKGGTE